jgi:hypothetical protein
MHKLTRISYNSGGWRQPTGDARKSETSGTYNREHGFGHEDWLFRDEWQIDGWRYAFIEGVNKSHRKLVKARVPIDLTLFTIQPDKNRRYVAVIRAVECLNDQQAEDALNAFKERGWHRSMLDEIKSAGGDVNALGDAKWAKHILNVRFRLENLSRFGPAEFIQADDSAMRRSRYMLYDAGSLPQRAKAEVPGQRKGSETAPSTHAFARSTTPATQCEPEHARMQAKLLAELRIEFPGVRIVREENFIDVSVDTVTELLLYEIKSDLEPRVVIRQALGQILEYAFHPQRQHLLPVRLVIVGQCALTPDDARYLELLRRTFSLPLEYRVVPL